MIFVRKILPFVDKHLLFDHFQSFDCGMFHESIMDAPEELPLTFPLQLVGRIILPVSRLLTISMSVNRPFLMTFSGIERRSIVDLMNF